MASNRSKCVIDDWRDRDLIDLHEVDYFRDSTKIINQVNVHINRGEVVALCGESGSGKSSLLNVMSGLAPGMIGGKLTGTRKIMGEIDVDQLFKTFANKIGMVFQNPDSQFINPDVYSELAFAMENMGIERDQMYRRINEMIKSFNFEELLHRPITSLSGGQKQLVACMASMILDPELYLLDEPTSNLDEQSIQLLSERLMTLKQRQKTIVIAEHRLDYLRDLVDRYIIMDHGQLLADIPSAQFWQHSTEYQERYHLRNLVKPQINLSVAPIQQSTENQITLKIDELKFQYPRTKMALKSSQLELNNQDVIGIIGENGAGKSTLLQLIAGLLKPKQGLFWLNQQKLSSKAKLRYSFVVMQNVRMQLFFESVKKELSNGTNEIKDNELIELLALQKLLKRRPQSLSGGQQQLVAIATALLSNKQFILLDEPTSGLDYETMLHLSQIINKIRQRKVLIIIVSHDLDFINMTCSQVIEMSHGEIKTMNRGQSND